MSRGDLDALWTAAPEARRALRTGRWEHAERALNERIAAAPARAELYALKSELLRLSPERREGEAVAQARRAAALAPARGWARAALSRALLARGDAAGALAALEGGSDELATEKAFAFLASGDAAAALAQARAADAGPDAALAEAAALARLGRLEESLSAAARARAAAARPGVPSAAELEADLLAALERWDEAAAARRRLAARGLAAAWPLPQAPDARARLLAALAARAERRPRDAWAWAWLADAAARGGDAARAAAAFERAARLAPKLGWARLGRARARAAGGDLVGALADARAALRDPRCAGEAEALRADLSAALGRGAESERGYGRARRAGFERAEMRARRAEVLTALGRPAEARVELDLCLEEAPSHPRAALLRAAARDAAGDAAGAAADRARAADPAGVLGVRGPFADVGPGEGPARPGRGRVGLDARVELAGLLQSAALGAAVPEHLRRGEPALAAVADEALRRFVPLLPSGLAGDFQRAAAARGNAAFPWFGITQMLMSVSAPPALQPVRRAWSDGDDLRLLARLRDFARRAGFWRFCARANARLRPRLRALSAAASREDYAATVSLYAGRRVSAFYEIAVSPLLRGVNLRAILIDDEGGRGARTVLCPSTSRQELAALAPESPFVLWSGWHEHLHLLLDPWTSLYAPEAARLEACYARIAPGARRKNWLDCLSEHFVRAATQRLIAARLGEPAALALAAEDAAEGYPFARRLALSLRGDYEANRARYPTLHAFIPRWLEDWRELP